MAKKVFQSPLLIIPSIDIKDGKLVRIVQGIPKVVPSIYPDDPIEMAKIWRAENAKCLHVVDFDGAWYGSNRNFPIIEKLISSVVIPVQVGGGLRTIEKIREAFKIGAARVVLGSIAVTNPEILQQALDEFGAEKIIVSLDVIKNSVMIFGRKETSALNPISLGLNMKTLGVKRLIVTDVERNGLMLGPNLELLKLMAEKVGIKITASGGVSGYKDLVSLLDLTPLGVDSVIIGRALYENKFPCQELWRIAEYGTII
ncbi:MAG: 1-(5-phosphoribosyl)-5-[(5-phosphoribosylamino)methylideneamino]imidazole-4-carboxamide isomerase [Ignavibacteria bacterium]